MNTVRASKFGHEIHDSNCFACSKTNKIGMRIVSEFHEHLSEVHFTHKFNNDYEGFPGYVHGGISATLLDEAQGTLCNHLGYMVMTEEISIKYHKAIDLNKKIYIRAVIVAKKNKRLYTKASIHNEEEELLISSSASFYIFSRKFYERKLIVPKEKSDFFSKLLEVNLKRPLSHKLKKILAKIN